MYVMFYVCVGIGFVDWLDEVYMRGFEVCICF